MKKEKRKYIYIILDSFHAIIYIAVCKIPKQKILFERYKCRSLSLHLDTIILKNQSVLALLLLIFAAVYLAEKQ